MRKKLVITALGCLLMTGVANAVTIKLECDYHVYHVNKSAEPPYSKEKKTYFEINTETMKVTGGVHGDGIYNPDDTRAKLTPDQISIEKWWEYTEHPKLENLAEQFSINRLDGKLYGHEYDIDPATKKPVIKYSFAGQCKPLVTKF